MEDKLMFEVKQKGALYDTKHPQFKTNGYRSRLWRDVSTALQSPVCQATWERLRRRYVSYIQQKTINGALPEQHDAIMKSLGYLRTEGNRKQVSSLPTLDIEEHNSFADEVIEYNPPGKSTEVYSKLRDEGQPVLYFSSAAACISSKANRRQRRDTQSVSDICQILKKLNSTTYKYDALDHFGLSVAGDLRNMEPVQQSRVKFEINKLLAAAKHEN